MPWPAGGGRAAHGEPAWAVRGKTLVTYSEHKPAERVGFWCPAPPGELEALVAAEPERFFHPPFGGHGWLGVYLDVPVDWTEVREIIVEAYRMVAPKRLAAEVGAQGAGDRDAPSPVSRPGPGASRPR